MTAARRTATFTALLQCKLCGAGLPLLGPMRTLRCAACLGDNVITPERIATYLHHAAGGKVDEMMGECKFGHRDGHPCAACGKLVALADGDACACGVVVPSFAPPPWLATELPTLLAIYGAERDPADQPADGVAVQVAKTSSPIVTKCPECGGALRVTGDSARTVACEHCSANVFLPDDLWRTLHPVKQVAPWSVVWGGERGLERLEDVKRREKEAASIAAEQAADRKQRDAEREEKRIAREAEEAAQATRSRGMMIGGVLLVVMIAILIVVAVMRG